MYIQLRAIRLDSHGYETENGMRITIRKDQISAVCSSWALNHEKPKGSYYRGNTNVYLNSGQIIPVIDKLEDVEAMLLA